MKTPKSINFFNNGAVVCFDKHGLQMPELQKQTWFNTWMQWLESQGIDPLKVEHFCFVSTGLELIPFKTQDGYWNYKMKT